MKMILISGKAEAGKTTTANIIISELEKLGLKAVKLAYGDEVKETAKKVWGWNGKKDEAGRHLLQWWGTDVVRAKRPNYWVESVVRLVDVLDGVVDYVLIDDCRFPNEIRVWQDSDLASKFSSGLRTVTVRVDRPGHVSALTQEQLMHPSETALDAWNFDVQLTARNYQELEQEVQRNWEMIVGKEEKN